MDEQDPCGRAGHPCRRDRRGRPATGLRARRARVGAACSVVREARHPWSCQSSLVSRAKSSRHPLQHARIPVRSVRESLEPSRLGRVRACGIGPVGLVDTVTLESAFVAPTLPVMTFCEDRTGGTRAQCLALLWTKKAVKFPRVPHLHDALSAEITDQEGRMVVQLLAHGDLPVRK